MRFTSTAFALAAALSTADAAYKGFNYGAFFGNNAAKQYVDFKYEFEAAKALPGTNGQFTSARLYTMIQHGTTKDVISAIQAAIDTKTSLLLGIWTSATTPAAAQTGVNNELAAFQAAVDKFGSSFTNLIAGISVGSEDLYRITPTALKNGEKNPGAQPSDLAKYVKQVKAFRDKNPLLKGKLVGHVDTWTAYTNGSNKAVIDSLEWCGVDAYPFWEAEHDNNISNGKKLFYDALNKVKAVAQGKPVWITETGWPVSGPTVGQAVASNANAKTFWNSVACQLMKDNVNLWYYTLQDVQYSTPKPSFGIKPGGDLKTVKPLFDLTCPDSAKFPSESPIATLSSSIAEIPTPTRTLSASTLLIDAPTPTTLATLTSSAPSSPTAPISTSCTWIPGMVLNACFPWPTQTTNLNTPPISVPSTSSMSLAIPTPSATPSLFPGFPVPNRPRGLSSPFVAPYLIVPIDAADPNMTIGNQYTAQVSPTRSTLFIFDVGPQQGKICNLVFALPPPSDPASVSPYTIGTSGGMDVSRLARTGDKPVPANSVSGSTLVGSVPRLMPGNKYLIGSAPCEAEQTVGYRIDSVGGLSMDFFQMTSPALGLFMEVV